MLMGTMLLLSLLMSSCATMKQPSLRIEHYTLEYGPPKPLERRPLPVTLKIERFSAAPPYDTQQMVYREGSFKRETYAYHRWRAHPGDLLSNALARDMRHSALFRAVLQEGSSVGATHIMEGSVDEFFEWNDEEGWKAVLTLTVTLIKGTEPTTSRQVLFQNTFRAVRPCKEKTPLGLAEAMSEAMARVSGEIIKAVHERLSSGNGHLSFVIGRCSMSSPRK